ncbi:hypothetical protein LI328DRAFT_168021 [Trichoderma asperelloides]|nr:hypothetical protein LI328DRAFT_168021 [Trichoderma asperelloides]
MFCSFSFAKLHGRCNAKSQSAAGLGFHIVNDHYYLQSVDAETTAPAWPKAWGEENELSMARRRPGSSLGFSLSQLAPPRRAEIPVRCKRLFACNSDGSHVRPLETGRPPLVQNPIEGDVLASCFLFRFLLGSNSHIILDRAMG